MMPRLVAALILTALATSCRWPLTPGTVDQLSIVYDVEAPDTVRAGEPFVVTFMSATGDPRWAPAEDEIRSKPDGILIVPRDRFYHSDAYPTVVVDVRHVVRLTLRSTGRRDLHIRSRVDVPDGKDTAETLVFPLTVLP